MQYFSHGGASISRIGVGGYALSGAYGPFDEQKARRVFVTAYELGVNFFDTADAYGDGERILGETVRPFRRNIILASKVGVGESNRPDLSWDAILQACERSLNHLQTEVIDLYQVHFDDPTTPVEETVAALEELAQAGKIRWYGLGHLPATRVEQYFQIGKPFSVLMEYSAVARDAEQAQLPLCQKYGAAALAFSVTGRGLLTGRWKAKPAFTEGDIRSLDPLFQYERLESALRVAGKLGEIGARYGRTPAQTAIAWVLAQPGVSCALTGPTVLAHLEENLAACEWALDGADLAEVAAFLKEEADRTRACQKEVITKIVSQPLQKNGPAALVDLMYVIETGIGLGTFVEPDVMPLALQLIDLRRAPESVASSRLAWIQGELKKLLQT